MNVDQHRRRQDLAATLFAVLVAGTGCAGALWPAVEHAITVALVMFAGLVMLAGLIRWGLRVLRERREDAADALAGAAWRAAHLPHPVHQVDGLDERAGVA